LYLDKWVELSEACLYFNPGMKEKSKRHFSTQDLEGTAKKQAQVC